MINLKYVLMEYHKNISKQELIDDLLSVSRKISKSYVSRSEYEINGKYSASPFLRCFGSWTNALSAANLETRRKKDDLIKISDKSLIDDIKRIASLLSKDSISTKDYSEHGNYKVQTLLSRFGTWANALELANLKPTVYKEISDEDLFEEIERLWIKKGSQPTTTDIKKGISKYSLNTYSRRFGGWRNALKTFLDYIGGNYIIEEKKRNNCNSKTNDVMKCDEYTQKHRTPRDINLRLRFMVLKRDNFKCCSCGASPATDSNIELQVDHIIPWANAGETVLENLQTLCSKCNYGKSNILI